MSRSLVLALFFSTSSLQFTVAAKEQVDTLQLDAPIVTWDEAIPLGNGLLGGLLWGEGNEIRLSLDRGDLWDERLPDLYLEDKWTYATIRKLKEEGNQREISRLFDAPYNNTPYPTKLPGGRLVLTLDDSQTARQFRLDMRRGVGHVDLTDGTLQAFFSATQPVAMVRVQGPPLDHKFIRPAGLDKLGYEEATFGSQDAVTWMIQPAALGLEYAVIVASRRLDDVTLLAVTITSNRDDADPLSLGKRRVASALNQGYATMRAGHDQWWQKFWEISSVTIPNTRLQRHYNLVKYFYGAASRPASPPMPLQGVWTRDDGALPPWKGDYHHDLNTQMTYLAYLTAGLLDSGMSFINYNWEHLPVYRKFAERFYGVNGAAMPGVATLAGKATGGWSQYSLSPVNGLWVGQSFYLHWRYTMDRQFLEERTYPWLSEIGEGITGLLVERAGKLYLPLSSSPEIHNNSLRAWLQPNSNYDLSLMHWAFDALAEMADDLERPDEARRWRGIRSKLDPLLKDDRHVLMFAPEEPFNVSHRHHSHTMAIHPLGTLHVEGTEEDRKCIHVTLDEIQKLGTQAWVGYSFSWFSCIAARAGQADRALKYLVDYERAFLLRNGFHANGDQIGAGLSGFRYRPFTLEGNFLAMEAIHEMLLQSWGGRLRVFPATPTAWADASFSNLRGQGGFVVSAQRQDGRTVSVSISATVDQLLRLNDPFDGGPFRSNREIERKGTEILCQLKAGESLDVSAE